MKIKDGFVVNKVGSQHVVVPVGEASVERHCMVRLNGTGAFLWNQLAAETTEEALVQALLTEYAVDGERRALTSRRFWASCATPTCWTSRARHLGFCRRAIHDERKRHTFRDAERGCAGDGRGLGVPVCAFRCRRWLRAV